MFSWVVTEVMEEELRIYAGTGHQREIESISNKYRKYKMKDAITLHRGVELQIKTMIIVKFITLDIWTYIKFICEWKVFNT